MITPEQITRLQAAIEAVCPIDGVSVAAWGDPATARVDYKSSATIAERAAASAALLAFDWSHTAQVEWQKQMVKLRAKDSIDNIMDQFEMLVIAGFKVILDAINELRTAHGLPARTWNQFRSAVQNKIDAE